MCSLYFTNVEINMKLKEIQNLFVQEGKKADPRGGTYYKSGFAKT
jgi:hypothetical protein